MSIIILSDILQSCSPDAKDYFEVVYRLRSNDPDRYPTDKEAYKALENARNKLGLKDRYSSYESFRNSRWRLIKSKRLSK